MDDTNSTNNTNNNTENRYVYVTPSGMTELIRLARRLLLNDPDCEKLEELGRLQISGSWSDMSDGRFDLALYGQLFDVLATKLTAVELYSFRNHPEYSSVPLSDYILETLCLPKFPNLQTLEITNSHGLSGSQLGDLLCAGGLHWLTFRSCDLTLEFLQQWKQAVRACPRKKCRLSKLHLDKVTLQDGQSVVELFEIVKLFPHLEVLRFRPVCSDLLSLAIPTDAFPGLKELDIGIGSSRVAIVSIEVFYRGLSKNQDVERLHLKSNHVLTAGPTQDVLVETVASLPALKEFRLRAEIDSPAKFLSSLLERLIQRQSKLTSLVICNRYGAAFMDECWFQWIPHLGPHFRNIEFSFGRAAANDNRVFHLIRSLRKNGYLLNISIGSDVFEDLVQICRRNKLLAQVKEKGCLSLAETTTMHQQQWAFLLEGMANRRNMLDSSPLFSFVQYNVSNITNAIGGARNKRKMN